IHQTGIERPLFRGVVVILVRRNRLRAIQAERVGGTRAVRGVQVWIVVEQSVGQSIDRWCVRRRFELRFPSRIQRLRIGSEVVIERNVLLENYHQMLNWSRGGTRCELRYRFGGRGESGSNAWSHGDGHRQ